MDSGEMITYEQARKDHEFLWSIGSADDMTGGYVDQQDLDKLLKKPTKSTARDCYCDQIAFWFQSGPEKANITVKFDYGTLEQEYPELKEIRERHCIDTIYW